MEQLLMSQSGKPPLAVALTGAREAGSIIADGFGAKRDIHFKGRGNVVTEVDLQAERSLLEYLQAEFPDHGIVTEESAGVKGASGFTWVIDPLDGSRNYASGIPHFGVNVALTRGSEVLVAVTYDPIREEVFAAQKGMGLSLNGRPMKASDKPDLLSSVLGFDMGYQDDPARQALEMVMGFWPGVQTLRVMGSAALGLAYVASGRLDLYFHHDLRPWDIVCGLLLIREAGGVITDHQGHPATLQSSRIVAGGIDVHHDFMAKTAGVRWRGV